MTKTEFLSALRDGLRALPEADAARSLEYYHEMIDDRMDDGMTEEEAVAAVGDPGDVAGEILREYVAAEEEREDGERIRCPRCSKVADGKNRFCPRCGYPFEKEPNSVSDHLAEPKADGPIEALSHNAREASYDLRWYRALIWFVIWFQAFLNGLVLINTFSAMTDSSFVGSGAESWAWTNVITTVLYIVYLVITRRALARWKKHAPCLYLISLFLPFLARVTAVAVSYITCNYFGAFGFIPLSADDIFQLVEAVVLFIPNLIYFRKRAALFTE